ncbi:MAG TPA: PqqD family protein [Polyangia bacterium]|nr:PqqD family protein [Polyangia bacterium]
MRATVIDLKSKIRRRTEVAFSAIPSGGILVDLKNGPCFELNQVAASYWELSERNGSLTSICDELLERFTVSRDKLESDVRDLTETLLTAGIIELVPPAIDDAD